MNKTGLVLLLSAVAVCLAQENDKTCQTRDIVEQFDQLANKTVPNIADESIQKLEKSLNDLYVKVETIIKPIEMRQEEIAADNLQSTNALLQKIEKVEQELTNETVIEIVEKSIEKSIGSLFPKIERLVNPIAAKLEALEKPGVFPSHPATSCKSIVEYDKSSHSDYYWLRTSNGNNVKVYCDMNNTCGGITGGWMRVAQLDTTKSPSNCPHPLSLNTQHGRNLCARSNVGGGCSEVHYQTNNIAFDEVCGRVIGYQWGSPDGSANKGVGINGAYIDGVSLTHDSPRQHIWSFIAAYDESERHPSSRCRCSNRYRPGILPASFVGTDYFCDSGTSYASSNKFYADDPLWDGAGCTSKSECCTFQNPPWFYKKLGASTNNNIDMRVCRNQDNNIDEDVLIEKVDIFVR